MHAPNPCAAKGHFWTPTPADARSAMTLVGLCRCLRCRKVATADDMRAFGATIKRDETFGEVMANYDVMRGA